MSVGRPRGEGVDGEGARARRGGLVPRCYTRGRGARYGATLPQRTHPRDPPARPTSPAAAEARDALKQLEAEMTPLQKLTHDNLAKLDAESDQERVEAIR